MTEFYHTDVAVVEGCKDSFVKLVKGASLMLCMGGLFAENLYHYVKYGEQAQAEHAAKLGGLTIVTACAYLLLNKVRRWIDISS